MQKIGVFVCWCGSNIAATVDVETVSDALAREPGVVFSTNYQHTNTPIFCMFPHLTFCISGRRW